MQPSPLLALINIKNFNLHVNVVNFHIIKIHEAWESNELKFDAAITDVYKEF